MIAAVLDLHKGPGAPLHPVNQMARCFAYGHDVIHEDPFFARGGEAETLAAHLLRIAEHPCDFRHGRKTVRIDLGGATGHDDGRAGALAGGAANGPAGLTNGLIGDRTGIDDHHVLGTGRVGVGAHDFGFIGIEAASQSDEFDARFLSRHRPSSPDRPSLRSTVPSKLVATGPVMTTWSSVCQ